MASEVRDDEKKYEIFVFTQGYGAGAKAGRAVFHGVADVLTLGVWEVIGTPTEGVFDGNEMAYEVRYDDDIKPAIKYLMKYSAFFLETRTIGLLKRSTAFQISPI
jgi:hypothetical protein